MDALIYWQNFVFLGDRGTFKIIFEVLLWKHVHIADTAFCQLLKLNNDIMQYNTLSKRVIKAILFLSICALCGSTKCSPTQYAPFSSILCTLHTQYAPLEHFVYPAYTICYQWSILCRVDTYVISGVVRGYTICSS